MNDKNNKKFKNFGVKGYYIALILCAAAIGISGYLYYRNTDAQVPSAQQSPAEQSQSHIPAVATDPTEDTAAPTPSNATVSISTVAPLSGDTIGEYAIDCLSYNPTTRDWRTHDGVDIAASAGTEVCAAADGTIYTVYDDEVFGKTIVIRHDGGYVTTYSSLDPDSNIATGKSVAKGEIIGTVSNNSLMETALGDHLHFSVSCNGISIDPDVFLKMK